MVKRLVRSTSVPIAERSSPMIRSPSPWPGTARSSASAGALADHQRLGDEALAARADAGARDAQRPAGGRHAVSSRARAPRPCTNNDW
jgi:hypothetical protein